MSLFAISAGICLGISVLEFVVSAYTWTKVRDTTWGILTGAWFISALGWTCALLPGHR